MVTLSCHSGWSETMWHVLTATRLLQEQIHHHHHHHHHHHVELSVMSRHWAKASACHFPICRSRKCRSRASISRLVCLVILSSSWTVSSWSHSPLVVLEHNPVQTGGIFYFPWHRHQIEGTGGFWCLLRKTLAKSHVQNHFRSLALTNQHAKHKPDGMVTNI